MNNLSECTFKEIIEKIASLCFSIEDFQDKLNFIKYHLKIIEPNVQKDCFLLNLLEHTYDVCVNEDNSEVFNVIHSLLNLVCKRTRQEISRVILKEYEIQFTYSNANLYLTKILLINNL